MREAVTRWWLVTALVLGVGLMHTVGHTAHDHPLPIASTTHVHDASPGEAATQSTPIPQDGMGAMFMCLAVLVAVAVFAGALAGPSAGRHSRRQPGLTRQVGALSRIDRAPPGTARVAVLRI